MFLIESFKCLARRLLGRRIPPLELSYSRINTYFTCPWMYKLVYIEGWRAAPTLAVSLGLTLHRTLEAYHRESRRLGDWETLLALYDTYWRPAPSGSLEENMDFYDRGRRMLERYYTFAQTRESQVLYVEKDFEFFLRGNRLLGTMDRIDRLPDGTFEVIEYKTHAETWSPTRIQEDFQMTLYAWAARHVLRLAPLRLSYLFLAKGTLVPTERTKQQEKLALAQIRTVAEHIRRGDFTPNLKHCPRCDFKTRCPFGRETLMEASPSGSLSYA